MSNHEQQAGDGAEDPQLTRLNELDAAIAAHPGQHIVRRAKDLGRTFDTWSSFSMRLSALLNWYESDDETISELIRNVGDRSKQDDLVNALDQAIVAYTAGIGA